MSGRLVACPHCGGQHADSVALCPAKALPLGARRHVPGSDPPSSSGGHERRRRPVESDLLGMTIGDKYRVLGILGQGGMGTVYEAEHLALGRSVAVKVLHARQMRKQESIRRFHHEARAAGAIGHPNICEVYDLGTLPDGRPYLVMERLTGETLSARIETYRALPVEEVVDILTQVLSGLVAAHAKGILHRDIKPENVFLAARVGCAPVAKLLDFGVSKMVGTTAAPADEDGELTRTGMVMGTPYYMSPEQARGERNLDARVDIYACGVLAYEAATGRRPFVAKNYNALLLQILEGNAPSPRTLRADLPASFAKMIEQAMALERSDRYADAADFQRDLQRLSFGPPRSTRGQTIADSTTDVSVIELSSDVLDSHHSLEVPALGVEDTLPTHARLNDYALPYDDDAATTLMRDDEILELASRARPSGAHRSASEAPPEPYNSEDTTPGQAEPPAASPQGNALSAGSPARLRSTPTRCPAAA